MPPEPDAGRVGTSTQPHLAYMDGLRAVAVIAVVLYHAICSAAWAGPSMSAPMSPNPVWWLATFASKGSHGVDLFFVISGFCLAYPILASIRNAGSARFDLTGFFAKRMVRILPPFYIAFALCTLWMFVSTHTGFMQAEPGLDFSPLALLRQLLFLDRGATFTNGSFWTLPVEFRWYLAFPLVLVLYVRSQRAFWSLLAACIVAFNLTSLRAIDIATLPAFMLGIVAADWQVVGHRLRSYAPMLFLIALDLAFILEPYSSVPSRFGLADNVGFFLQTNVGWQLVSFFLVVSAGSLPALRRAFEWRPLCAVGVAAYAIYLTHQPLEFAWGLHGGMYVGPFVHLGVDLALSLGVGFGFWYVAERPFVERRTRARLVAALAGPIGRALTFAGLPQRFELAANPAAPAVRRDEAVPEPLPDTVAAYSSLA
jgi:peptidoglycan/LPS O-acetylase OafA/YrhL